MRAVGGLDGGPDLGVRLRGHAAEGRPRGRVRDIGGLSAVDRIPRHVVDRRPPGGLLTAATPKH
ncbi:hypothetical protein GCM10010451_36250 [Streptomyces virens]|uniref:Uncharacterized protein n=1 Tax=Streptomyces virens TaxID=285572 RepID=A0ABP6PMU0_9ACTN